MEPEPFFKNESLDDYVKRLREHYFSLKEKPKKYEEMFSRYLIPAHTTAIVGTSKFLKKESSKAFYENLTKTGEFDFSKEGFVYPKTVISVLEYILPEMLTGTKILIRTYSASPLVISSPAYVHSMNSFSTKKIQWYVKDLVRLKEDAIKKSE